MVAKKGKWLKTFPKARQSVIGEERLNAGEKVVISFYVGKAFSAKEVIRSKGPSHSG